MTTLSMPSRGKDNFNAVKTISDRLGLPLRFERDLEIDRKVMEEHPEKSWVWVLYEGGTLLWTIGPELARCTFGKWVRAVKQNCASPHFYFVSGGNCRPLTADELSREHWVGG